MNTEDIKRHTLGLSIALHLVPGILIGAFYTVLTPFITDLGFPSIVSLILAGFVVLVPFELGILLYEGKRTGAEALKGVVLYRQPLPLRQYLIWVPVIFVASGLLMTLLTPVTTYLQTWFTWIPDVYQIDMGLDGGYSKTVLIVTYLLNFLMITLVGPVVEELYFRGYLLPRIPRLKGWAPVLHTLLFALYHTWTPWVAVARTLAVLPLTYIVRWKNNIYLGIIAHCLLNAIDLIIGIVYIASM
jgi:hypothetical protein